MKLSMWMIANRLTSLDATLEISSSAAPVLNSVRLVYATDCLYVYQDGDRIICDGEGDRIIIYDMDLTMVFEIMQSVFDYFEEWSEQVHKAIRDRNYQVLIDHCNYVFQNPVFLIDGNEKVLGMSRDYPADSIDPEWSYMTQFGYASSNSLVILSNNRTYDVYTHGIHKFASNRPLLSYYGGLTYCMHFNEVVCGRLTVLEKNRPLNPGDVQLITRLSEMLEPYLGQSVQKDGINENAYIFDNLISGKPYDKEALQSRMSVLGFGEDSTYQLAIIEASTDRELRYRNAILNNIVGIIQRHLPTIVTIKKSDYLILLCCGSFSENKAFLSLINSLIQNNPITIGISLPVQGIGKVPFLLSQAQGALAQGRKKDPALHMLMLEDYGLEYMLSGLNSLEIYLACHPGTVSLWELKSSSRGDMYDTLKTYLDNGRSVNKTSTALFMHRNTVIYRIKKITDYLDCDLDNVDLRNYIRTSMYVLEQS